MINFIKYQKVYLTISLIVLIPGFISLLMWGFAPSIDFVGGTLIEVQSPKVKAKNFKEVFDRQNIDVESIRENGNSIIMRLKPIKREQWELVRSSLEGDDNSSNSALLVEDASKKESIIDDKSEEATTSAIVSTSIKELRFETVGPVLGAELLRKTLIAAALAIIGILLYVAWAFKDIKFGISAVIALFHDVFVVMGIFSLLGHFYGVEVDVLFVTAILTTMSFSVHDTIVVFDRIRESMRRDDFPFDVTVNKALTDTMTRSVNNSMTIIFMLLALVLLGGDTIRWFSTALLIGTISGTYSSPFVATQLLYIFLKKKYS